MTTIKSISRALASLALVAALSAPAQEVQITGIQSLPSSVRVYFAPFQGAKDYAVYDTANPLDWKFAGLIHLTAGPGCSGVAAVDQLPGKSCWQRMATNADGSYVFPYKATEFSYPNGAQGGPTGYDGPAYFIEWNGAGDGLTHRLQVVALDALGPVPKCNLYRETDIKAYTAMFDCAPMPGMPLMLGSNKGMTEDHSMTVTNGQGPYTNKPKVIGTSKPFDVQADRTFTPIIPGASQVFYDTFENSQAIVQQPGNCETFTNDQGDWGGREWIMDASNGGKWRIIARQINCAVTVPFIMSNHFMDVLADRDATIYGSLSLTPERSFQLNGGILHLTQEVDDVMFGDRWMDFNITPAGDPLVHWNHQDAALNASNRWLFMMNFGPFSQFNAQLLISDGPVAGPKTPGAAANPWSGGVEDLYDSITRAPNGLGLDNKRRWDFFLSATHAALFIDGRLVKQGPLPADKSAWLTGPLKVYFSHYSYHSEAGWKSMLTSDQGYGPGFCNLPIFAYWFSAPETGLKKGEQVTAISNGQRVPANGYGLNNCQRDWPAGVGFRNTDERHWDNMGASVLPASITKANDFSSLAALVQPPLVKPVGSQPPPPPVPVNCTVSEWSAWTAGPVGFETRTRTVVTRESNGGTCLDPLSESRPVVVTPPPPVVLFRVPPTPAYPVSSSGRRSSTAAGYVPSGTLCGKRLGSTNYFSIQGQKDVNGNTITGNWVANCTQVSK